MAGRSSRNLFLSIFALLHADALAYAQRQQPFEGQLSKPPWGSGTVFVEAESLMRSGATSAGGLAPQDMRSFGQGWSRDAQLFWNATTPGSQLQVTFWTGAGRYQVFLAFTKAPDYALVRTSFDGKPGVLFNGYAPSVSRDRALLGMFDLTSGVHELLLQVAGRDPKSSGFRVGLDRLEFEPVAPGPAGSATVGQPNGGNGVPATALAALTPRLAFAQFTPDGGHATLGATERAVYRPNLTLTLAWEPAATTATHPYRWQVSRQPFPRETTPGQSPPGLLADGSVTPGSFRIALGSIPPLGSASTASAARAGGAIRAVASGGTAPSRQPVGSVADPGGVQIPEQPIDFYIRVFAVAGGQPVGLPSNSVIAHFRPGSDPDQDRANASTGRAIANEAERAKKLAEMTEQAKIYKLAIVAFKPMVFEDPNRWGCVFVLKNPYYGVPLHPLGTFKPNHEYCPPVYHGQGKNPGLGDVLMGWVKAYEILTSFYDDAKSWVASQMAKAVPCAWLGGDAAATCDNVARSFAEAGLSVGLAGAGVPPTLPKLSELDDLAKGKIADLAADYSCTQIEAHGGHCTPAMHAMLAKLYKTGIDKVQVGIVRNAKEPGCENVQEAHDNGREPFPCFTRFDGADVRPATGTVTEPAQVTVAVTRVKAGPPFEMPACRVRVDLSLSNHFPGGYVHGANQPPADLHGQPFLPADVVVPSLALGQSVNVTAVFSGYRQFHLPTNHDPNLWWDDWMYLYRRGTGPLSVGVSTITPVPGAKGPSGSDLPLSCGVATQTSVQIPN